MLPDVVRRAIHFLADDVVWGPWTMALLFATGVFLTVRLRFVQVVCFREALRTLVAPADAQGKGPLSAFQAFMTALGASIGTGNIAGVATAIVTGGPGALFWIWAYGFFATSIKFTEAVLGIHYRQLEGDRLNGGPMHYLRNGMHMPRLAWVYGLVAGIAALTTTPFTQPNSIAVVVLSETGVPTLVTGIVLAILTALVVIGGIKWIGRASEALTPVKVGLYLLGGLVVIATHIGELPGVLVLVFTEAFSGQAALGGTAGVGMMVAMRYGVARGIYANEAGYGTAAVAYATARSRDPRQQGLNAVMEVFVVSFVTSSISALAILVTGVWRGGRTSAAVVAQAFDTSIPGGGYVVAVCAFLFGYSTLIGWAYYGEQFLEYVAGTWVRMPYRITYCVLVVFGAISKVDTVWAWGDLMNGLQIFPNLVGLIGLSGVAAAFLRGQGPTRPS